MKKAFKKQMAVVLEAIATIGCLSICFSPAQEQSASSVISVKDEIEYMQIYMMDSDKTLVPLSIPVSEEMSEEDKLVFTFSYMSGKQETKGFTSLFTKECTLQPFPIKNGIVSLHSGDSLKNYDKENELHTLEIITQGATQFYDIKQVKFYLNDKQLTSMPNAQTPTPEILNRSIGINHLEILTATLHNSTSLTVFYTKKVQGNEYMTPKSKRVAQSQGDALKANVENILSDISVSSALDQPLYADDTKVSNFDVYDGSLIVDLSKNTLASNHTVKQDVYNALVLSLATLFDIEKVEVRMDGVTISPKDQKEDMVPVHALTYNEVQFQRIQKEHF